MLNVEFREHQIIKSLGETGDTSEFLNPSPNHIHKHHLCFFFTSHRFTSSISHFCLQNYQGQYQVTSIKKTIISQSTQFIQHSANSVIINNFIVSEVVHNITISELVSDFTFSVVVSDIVAYVISGDAVVSIVISNFVVFAVVSVVVVSIVFCDFIFSVVTITVEFFVAVNNTVVSVFVSSFRVLQSSMMKFFVLSLVTSLFSSYQVILGFPMVMFIFTKNKTSIKKIGKMRKRVRVGQQTQQISLSRARV